MSRVPFYLSEALTEYVAEHSVPLGPVAAELVRETATLSQPELQIAPEQGVFLRLLVELMGASRILEIGTFTGLSALMMAQGMPAGGHLVACDVNEVWTAIARRYWEQAGVADRITLRLGPALATLQAIADEGQEPFDLVFIDADKGNYWAYFEQALPMLRPGGVVAADNTLWSGRVVNDPGDDADLRAIRDFNERIARHPDVETLLLPVFDGLTFARKHGGRAASGATSR